MIIFLVWYAWKRVRDVTINVDVKSAWVVSMNI